MRKNILITLLFFGFVSISPHLANAIVDLKNANYADAWVDFEVPGSGYELRVNRTYNSRSLFNGMFGFGWCSEFETKLDITPEGNVKLTECGAGLEVLYQARGFDKKDIAGTVNKIIAREKQDNKSSSAGYLKNLRKRLQTEPYLRYQYAAKYKITSKAQKSSRFLANGVGPDYIEKKGNTYVRVNPEGSTQRFSADGKLKKMFDRNGNFLSFKYSGKKLVKVTDNNGRSLDFQYHPSNGKVKSVVSGKLKSFYKYKNQSDLIWVKAGNKKVFKFQYDNLHNLVRVTYPNKQFKEIKYKKSKDWVIGYRDLAGCRETYSYVVSKKTKDHFWSTIKKVCKKKVILQAKYEFWYKVKRDKTGKYLYKNKTIENGKVAIVVYNENGSPIRVTKNKKTSKFAYYPDGLLKSKTTPDGITTKLAYHKKFKKVIRVTKGKQVSRFKYDKKGNLYLASNSAGQRINLKYDTRGRIIYMKDQAKRVLTLKYEERFGKPRYVERVGVGSISISYDTKGKIKKVSSKGGTTVAYQVANTFNNLLDLIQPSGVALSL